MSQPKEIELKFQLSSPKEIRAILADELFAGQEKKEATTLYSTYYDTEDLRLNQNKIAYRIRKTAEGLEATAKSGVDDSKGLFVRNEWNAPIRTRRFSSQVFAGTPIGVKLFEIVGNAEVKPLFRTQFKRTVINYEKDDLSAEIAFDQGKILAQEGKQEAILEMEMELKAGDINQLLSLGQTVAAKYPLHFGLQSKYERGLILSGIETAPPPSPDVQIEKDESLQSGIQKMMLAAFQTILYMHQWFLLSPQEVESVHQLRVSIRQLRSLCSFVKPFVEEEPYAQVQSLLREMAQQLAEMREMDVLAEEYMQAAENAKGFLNKQSALLKMIGEKRLSEQEQIHAIFLSGVNTPKLLAVLAWIYEPHWKKEHAQVPFEAYVDEQIAKRKKKISRALKTIDMHQIEQVHPVRIQGKKLRYLLKVMKKQLKKPQLRLLKDLDVLQELLGSICDIEVQIPYLKSFGVGSRSIKLHKELALMAGYRLSRLDGMHEEAKNFRFSD